MLPPRTPGSSAFSSPLWGPSISGNATVRGQQADVDVGVGKILKHTDGMLMIGFELRKNNFGFYAQPNWLKLDAEVTRGPLSGNDQIQLWVVDAGGF